MACGIEEQCAESGKYLIGVAEPLCGSDEGEHKRKDCTEAEKHLIASCHLIHQPIEEFGEEKYAEEPNGSGESLPHKVLPLISGTGHERCGHGGKDEGEDYSGDEELAHSLVEER